MQKLTPAIAAGVVGSLAPLTSAGTAAAVGGPGGYGNAQDTINALQAQGFNVQLNGAAVPFSGEPSVRVQRPVGHAHPSVISSAPREQLCPLSLGGYYP